MWIGLYLFDLLVVRFRQDIVTLPLSCTPQQPKEDQAVV
jgi:hypothetical protein